MFGALTGSLLLGLGLAVTRIFVQRAVSAKTAIKPVEGINSLEKIELGGAEQWILIRGWDRKNPLLLFLHSGPGFPEMPFAHLNAELEKQFVVVHWDQRGAGKSFPAPRGTMNVEQYVKDAEELSALLLKRFGARKLFLVAHSWGSLVGALVVSRHPELFHAYVGISQFADAPDSEKMMYQFALELAEKIPNSRATRELTKIGPPPYRSMRDFRRMKSWVEKFNRGDHEEMSRWTFVRLAFASPVYSWADLARIPLGAKSSFDQLWSEAFYKVNLFKDAPRIDVPVYFFLGRHDRLVTTSAAMAERYFQALDAPRGKELIWFENSEHWPQLQEPQKFRSVLMAEVLKKSR